MEWGRTNVFCAVVVKTINNTSSGERIHEDIYITFNDLHRTNGEVGYAADFKT